MDEQRSNKGQKGTWEGRRVAKSGGVATHLLQRNKTSNQAQSNIEARTILKHNGQQ
jgi:hypothetical protein